VTVLPSPLCWTALSRAPLKPLLLTVAVLPEPPSIVIASSQMYGNQTFSIVQVPRQWMPSPTVVPKIDVLDGAAVGDLEDRVRAALAADEQSSRLPCTVRIMPS
jgi:hypothetical protein